MDQHFIRSSNTDTWVLDFWLKIPLQFGIEAFVGKITEFGVLKVSLCFYYISRFQNIFMLAMAGGDTEKLTQGIFENYLDVKMKDSRMHAVSIL